MYRTPAPLCEVAVSLKNVYKIIAKMEDLSLQSVNESWLSQSILLGIA